MSYKLLKDALTNKEANTILNKTTGAYIPKDAANTDYQEYLEWAKTNTPEEAD
tara:strand:+ start:19992 stop:20150 length:159 start_codon:yes stop_codon:yes gene_type:complete